MVTIIERIILKLYCSLDEESEASDDSELPPPSDSDLEQESAASASAALPTAAAAGCRVLSKLYYAADTSALPSPAKDQSVIVYNM